MSHRIFALSVLLLVHMSAFGAQAFTVTREELAMMPPYCTAFYGKEVGLPESVTAPLNSTIPAGCPSLHHYCDGLKAMIRVDRNRTESGFWLEASVRAFQSVLQGDWWASCPLRPEAYVNIGKAQLLQSRRTGGSSGEAVTNLMKALELKPDYVPAYYALGDFYSDMGDQKKALSVVEDGLRYSPKSKGLLRRFKALGGTVPPTPNVVTGASGSPDVIEDTPTEQQPSAAEDAVPPPAVSAVSEMPDSSSESPTSPKIGSPSNPWCRFCPAE
ncbi:MAG: tetratricopeptide repeat protein [Gammaproteobacteria bacterium]|nr:tetratricopeptide repeat protein [Gammaproteobacteria bacterium]